MLILQIALGIVLAVVMLMFWDVILASGVVLLLLAIAAVGVFYALETPSVGGAIVLASLFGYGIYWNHKRPTNERPKPPDEVKDGEGVELTWRSLTPSSKTAIVIWLLVIAGLVIALLFELLPLKN